jgi:hypothetical protein
MSYDDVTMYGEDLIRDSRRWARAELGNELNQLRARVDKQAVETNRQRCQNALDADPELGGKWRKLNSDPGFLHWLAQEYDLAGVPRQQLLNQAYDLGDAQRVANFFKAFIASKMPARERTPERLPFETPRQRTAVRPSTDQYAAKKRIWTNAEIRAFYTDCRKGRYDEHEGERLRIEQEILAAAKEGRVSDASVQPHMPDRIS